MKKYFVLLLLSFVLVSCNKTETQPITTTEVPKINQQIISESQNAKNIIENNISKEENFFPVESQKDIEEMTQLLNENN